MSSVSSPPVVVPFASSVHQYQYDEVVGKLTTEEQKLEFASRFEKVDALYQECVTKVANTLIPLAALELELMYKGADRAYTSANSRLIALRPLAVTQTQKAFYEGTVIKLFRDLDSAIARRLGRPLHRYCGCNILEQSGMAMSVEKRRAPTLVAQKDKYDIPYPKDFQSREDLNHRSAVLYSWSYGGGHDAVQSALAQRYANTGMHVYNVQMDEEMLDCDPVWNMTRNKYSTRDLIGYLMTNNWWKTIRVINWCFSGAPRPAEEAKRIRYLVNILLLRGLPDVALSCVARFVGSMEKAGARTGVLYANYPSDLDPLLFDLQDEKDVEHPHFVHGVAARDPDLNQRITLPERRIVDAGLPVRPAILKKYSTVEIDILRKTWGVSEGSRIVIVLAGRDGVRNDCAEQVLAQYDSENGPKIHVIAVCGKNESERVRLLKSFGSTKNLTVFGLADEEQMGQLYAMASDSTRRGVLVSAKGGGGTVMESIASGTPLLVSDLNGLHWEKENIGFVERNKLGLRYTNNNEIADKLAEILSMSYENPFLAQDSVEKSLKIMSDLLLAGQGDKKFQALREANSRLFV